MLVIGFVRMPRNRWFASRNTGMKVGVAMCIRSMTAMLSILPIIIRFPVLCALLAPDAICLA